MQVLGPRRLGKAYSQSLLAKLTRKAALQNLLAHTTHELYSHIITRKAFSHKLLTQLTRSI